MLTRLLKWLWDDAPVWLMCLEDPVAWLRCKVHGHEDFVEMDNRSHVCVYCHKLLWREVR